MRTIKILIAMLAVTMLAAGCGGEGEGGSSPREQSMDFTYEGSYQVKGLDSGRAQGVGIYSNGSFRIVMEGAPRVVIHNEQSGENWMINLAQKSYEVITYDDALLKAGFMPHLYMKGYFDLEQFWSGPEFRWDTPDGRSIVAYLGGPRYLPSQWEAELNGTVLKGFAWEYRRVDHVSPDNFELPEGLTLEE